MSLREEIVQAAVANIHPDPDNLKTHTETNLDHIKAAIEKFGFADPIGVVENPDAVAGGYMVVEGHGRLEAAKRLKLKTVPVIVLDLNEAQRRGYGIAHNQIQQITGMDQRAVASEFERLGVGSDDYVALGYSEEDVLFLPDVSREPDQFSAPDGGEYREQPQEQSEGEIGSNHSSWQSYIPAVHKTAMRFASDTGYSRFLELLGQLRIRYPLAGSIGDRIQLLLTDMDVPTNGETTEHAVN